MMGATYQVQVWAMANNRFQQQRAANAGEPVLSYDVLVCKFTESGGIEVPTEKSFDGDAQTEALAFAREQKTRYDACGVELVGKGFIQ